MSGYLLGPFNGGVMENITKAQKKLNDVRQLVTTVSERPAVKTSGERATLIAYRETSWLKKQLGEIFELLSLANADANELYDTAKDAIQTGNELVDTLEASNDRIMRESISLDDLEAWLKEEYEKGAPGVMADDVSEHFDVSTGLAYAALLKLENERRIVRSKGEFRTFTYSDVG